MELAEEINTRKETWKKEQEEYLQKIKDEKELPQKAHKREEEDYCNSLEFARRKEHNQYTKKNWKKNCSNNAMGSSKRLRRGRRIFWIVKQNL